ncbi:carboxylate--amine ligase [Halomicrobium sp. HM KBTZ05]|uniref:carboxylate--amine ligase n=1 Tax=Halomicrobium sp. HM KBTZ05 TaxID=3242663 RepID=UPI003558C7AB
MAGTRDGRREGVVVPGIDTASSTAAVRSLGRRSIPAIVASEHDTPPAAASAYCEESVTVPDPAVDFPGYETALLELARRDDVATILPFREPDVYALARNRDQFREHVGTPWPTLGTLRQVQDRVALFEAADRAGVATPRTRTLSEWSDWEAECIVKPRYTFRAPEYADRFADPETQWSSTTYLEPGERPDGEAIVEEMGHVPLVQEYVPTIEEYGFFAQYDHGSPVATFQHRQRRGWKYCGGPSAFRESVDIPALERAGRALLDELDWHGVAMVEFLRDPRTGAFKLMEINPRFWSSLPFTVQAGVDFPLLAWAQATDRPIDGPPDYEVGIGGHLLRGEALHLHSVLTEEYPLVERPSFPVRAGEIAASLLGQPRFDYLSTDDPGPFVRDVRNTVRQVTGDTSADGHSESNSASRLVTAVQRLFVRE